MQAMKGKMTLHIIIVVNENGCLVCEYEFCEYVSVQQVPMACSSHLRNQRIPESVETFTEDKDWCVCVCVFMCVCVGVYILVFFLACRTNITGVIRDTLIIIYFTSFLIIRHSSSARRSELDKIQRWHEWVLHGALWRQRVGWADFPAGTWLFCTEQQGQNKPHPQCPSACQVSCPTSVC